MVWWQWMVIALVLAGLEMATPGGFFVVFFGAGALVVGFLGLAGLDLPQWLQWLLFSFFSIVALLLFREPLLRAMRERTAGAGQVDALTDDVAITLEEMAPGAVGRAELRGSTWSARNGGQATLAKGVRCRVLRVDGLMLVIDREGA